MQNKNNYVNIEGLDISSWQTITNADVLFDKSSNYIILRAYGSSSAPDTTFNERVAMARSRGVPCGSYYFGTPRFFATDAEAITHAQGQAQQYIDLLYGAFGEGDCGDLVPFLDIEEYKDFATQTVGYPKTSGMTPAQMLVWIKAFRDYFFLNSGRRVGFYSNRYFLTDPSQMPLTTAQLTEISDMPLWLAEYDQWYGGTTGNVQPANLGGWTRYALWQYAVQTDADQYGLSHGENKVDHNRTDHMSWLLPPPPIEDFYLFDNHDTTLWVEVHHPNVPDYIGCSIYLNDVWKAWVAPNQNGRTITGLIVGNTYCVRIVTEDNYHDTTTSEAKEVRIMPKARAKHGITTTTVDRLTINAGALWKNLFEASEELIGATSGGNTFVVEQEIKIIEIDGAKGPLKGARRVTESVARITANIIEHTTENVLMALAGADATDWFEAPDATATHDKIKRTRNIIDSDYVKNIGIVGETSDGKDVIIIIENALADGGFELAWEDKEEGILETQFTAHYDPANINSEPWAIYYPKLP